MLSPANVERQMVEVLAEYGRAPTGPASVQAMTTLCSAIAREANKGGLDVNSRDLRSAIEAACADRPGQWPSAYDVIERLGGGKTAEAPRECLSDAPTCECSLGCRRGVLEWIEPAPGERKARPDGPRLLTACVCAAGKWVRARPALRVSLMDPDDCRRRGMVPDDHFDPVLHLSEDDVAWLHARLDAGVGIREAMSEWRERFVPESHRQTEQRPRWRWPGGR